MATEAGTNDEDLMRALARGEQAALGALYARWAPVLERLVRRRLGSAADADDVVQQTFLQLHRARRDFAPGMKVRPWLFTIAFNLCRDHARRRARRRELPVDDLVLADDQRPSDAHEAAQVQAQVRAALGQLSAEQRTVIELHWFEELPFAEIATIVGATAGAVRVRAHRGYQALRQALGRDIGWPNIEEVTS